MPTDSQEPERTDDAAALRRALADARQQIQAGESRYRMILNSAVDYAIIALDLDGRVTQWNEGACRMLGWTEAEMLGQPASVFFTLADRQQGIPQAEMHASITTGRGNDERWHLRKDGSCFWANGEMMPLQDDSGAVQGFIKVLRDRTEQRQAAEKNRQDAEFLRGVLASSGDCIKVLDLDANLIFMSERGQRIMEVSDFNAIRGCPWPDFWHGPGNAAAKRAIETAKAGGVGHFQGAAETMAGNPRWWDVQVTPILGADGRPEKLLSVSRDVTEVHEAKERIELALDAGTVVGTWVWDIRADRFKADRRFARAFSLDPDRLAAGLSLREVVTAIHPDDLARVDGLIAKAMAEGGRYAAEYRVRQMDGSWLWMEASGYCELDAEGQPLRFPGALFDIDRRKRHELRREALLALGETLRELRSTDDSTAMVHAAAEIVGRKLGVSRAGYGYVDDAQERLTVDDDWCADASVVSVAGQHSFASYGNYVDALKRGETVSISNVEHDPRTRPNAERLSMIGVKALLNVPLMQGGRFVALLFLNDAAERVWTEDEIAFVRAAADRTWAAMEQASAETKLRQLNQTLEAQVAARTADRNRLWQMSSDIMLLCDMDGAIAAVNPAWKTMLGWQDDELIGTNLFALIHPDDQVASVEGVRDIAAGHTLQRFENRYRHKDDGYRWISWTAGPGDGMIVAVGRDVTEEKERAAALQQTEEKLRQSQKMEAVGQLTGGLAHDFNNLLTGVTGSLELLQTRIAQGRIKDVDRYINAAQGAAKRAAALTHRLLAFSRRQTLDPKPTDVNRLIQGMEELIQRTVGPEITVEPTVTAPGLWPTLVDPGQLENALLNLCLNARDAMPDGGRITIETANRRLGQRAAAERDLKPGQYVSMCVSDTGSGMPPDVIAKAFDPFFTTKPLGQGTGLGLSMIYGFAKQSGGQVRIYSELHEGTMVCIYLPRHVGPSEAAEDMPELAHAPRAEQGETVLVVDDEPTVRMLVTEVLEDLGYTAIEAADGASGLKVLQSDVRIDLLVTDVGLPGGMNGRQVADAARVARPDLKVLFITGYAEAAVINHEHLDAGMHVLTKPFAMEALASRIKELIDGR